MLVEQLSVEATVEVENTSLHLAETPRCGLVLTSSLGAPDTQSSATPTAYELTLNSIDSTSIATMGSSSRRIRKPSPPRHTCPLRCGCAVSDQDSARALPLQRQHGRRDRRFLGITGLEAPKYSGKSAHRPDSWRERRG